MFDIIVKVGMIIQKTLSELEHLDRDIAEWVMIHNLHENSPVSSSLQDSSEQAKTLVKILDPRIKQINSQIKALNRIGTIFRINKRVKLVNKDALYKLIRRRFGILADKNSVELTNENFELKKYNLLLITRQSLFDYLDATDARKEYSDFKLVEMPCARQLKNAADIMSIGIHDVAVFTAGRAVEDIINDYIRYLTKIKKIKKIKINETKFENKLGMLWKNSLITEKMFHDLQSVRLSRNDTGHPSRRSYKREDSLEAISNAYSLIQKIQKKIKKTS